MKLLCISDYERNLRISSVRVYNLLVIDLNQQFDKQHGVQTSIFKRRSIVLSPRDMQYHARQSMNVT